MIIRDRHLRDALLHAISDEQSRRVLAATTNRPRSVRELIHDEDLASSSAYRLVHELEREGLLVVVRTVLSPDGKSYKMYKATFREVAVKYNTGEIAITAVPNLDVIQKAFRLFHSFKEE